MSGRGGYRPGAGRKAKRLDPVTQSPVRAAELTLAENLPKVLEVLLQLALDGDKTLLVYCVDRVLGRPVQPLDVGYQVADIAAEYGVEPERVTSIVARLKARQAG